MRRPSRRGLAAMLLAAAAAAPAAAQTNDEVSSGIQLNFSNPGARSLAMGGAFLAFADDATAAYANPAGLTHLIYGGSEFSAEVRSWRFNARFPDHGRHSGELSNIGVDTVEGIEVEDQETEEQGLSFVSVGHVLRGGIAVALYRHRLATFSTQFETDGIFFAPSGGASSRTSPIRSSLDLDILNYGVSAAWEKPLEGEASLSVGLGVSYYDLKLDSLTERFAVEAPTGDRDQDRAPGGFFGPPDRLGDNVFSLQSQSGRDAAWGAVAGLLWKIDPRRRWSLGAVYHLQADFDVGSTFTYGPAAERQSGGTVRSGEVVANLGGAATFVVPETLGLGFAYNNRQGSWRAALDVDLVRYSRMSDELANLLLAAPDARGFEIDDVIETHLGVEYVVPLTDEGLIGALRGGIWHEPAHKLHYTGPEPRLRFRFPEGEDEVHLAAGFGLAIGESFQVDVGADWADRSRTTSVSVVWFF